MVGIDTNVLVRFLTADDAVQHQKTVELFEREQIFISDSVFLESEWVLRYSYKYPCHQICDAFRKVIGLENVTVNDAYYLDMTVSAYAQGMDFADALHWIGNRHCFTFFSFDRKFIQKTNQLYEQLGLPIAQELV